MQLDCRRVVPIGAPTHDARDMDETETIPLLFAACVRATPLALAIDDGAGSLTYDDLDRRSNRLAAALRARGVGPGDAVGVAFERSIDLPTTLVAILKTGAAYVPLDLGSSVERVAFTIANAKISAVVTRGSICEPSLYDGLAIVSLIDDAAAIAAYDDANFDVAVSPDAAAYVMYTSGSTGRPKGVAVSHRNISRLVRDTDYCDMSIGHTFLHFAPLAFDASTFEIWAPLLNGAKLAIARPGLHSVAELGATIERLGVTTMWLTTALFNRVVDGALPSCGGLRHVLTGGDVGSPRHLRAFLARYPSCRLSNGYGPTENTTFSTVCEYTTPESIGDDASIGRPIARSTAYVLDERLELVAAGTIGELCVGGDGVALGYVDLPELTAERFVADPFATRPGARMYRTGDRARVRPDGRIAFLGRLDDQVKVRGYRIELGEIEAAILAHTDVLDAAVVVANDAEEKVLIAYAVPATGVSLDPANLRARLLSGLPAYMVPHRIDVLERLPEHASGKLDRVALTARATAGLAAKKAFDPPPPPKRFDRMAGSRGIASLERAIASCWRNVLGEDVESDINFFDAGGDSLRLLKLHELLVRTIEVDIPTIELFEYTTIAKQAVYFSEK